MLSGRVWLIGVTAIRGTPSPAFVKNILSRLCSEKSGKVLEEVFWNVLFYIECATNSAGECDQLSGWAGDESDQVSGSTRLTQRSASAKVLKC